MAITFKEHTLALQTMLYFDSVANTHTVRGSVSNPTGSDLFPDTGVSVGDAIVFGGHQNYGKYRKITINLATPVVATGITGVWEYASRRISWAVQEWTPLNVVKDNTNSLQNAGANTVTFEAPDNWINFGSPGVSGRHYRWYIRFRIISISGLTEGGALSAVSGSTFTELYRIRLTGHTESLPATLIDIYNADKAGTTTMASRTITSVDGVNVTNDEELRPADYSTLGGARNDLWVTVASLTGITSLTVRLIGTDVLDNIQTEDIVITTNGINYATKSFKTLTATQVISITGTGSFNYVAEYGQWGVVSRKGNLFSFRTQLFNDWGNFIQSKQEVLQMEENYYLTGHSNCSWLLGELFSGDMVHKGSTFIFLGKDINYPASFVGANSKIFNSVFRHERLAGSTGFNGYWGGGIGRNANQTVFDVFIDGFRNTDFFQVGNTVLGVKFFGGHCEQPGAIVKDHTCFGGQFSFRPHRQISGHHVHTSDMSAVSSSPINPWQPDRVDNWVADYVDCNWGTFADTNKVRWTIQGSGGFFTNMKLYETASVLIKAVDNKNNPLVNANLQLHDKDGTEILNITSNADGVFGVDGGTATATGSTLLEDTTKNWATDQWWYKEVVMTSGGALNERRIISKGNTATRITAAWDFQTTPSIGDRFIIIPYMRYKRFVPDVPVAGWRWSTVTDSNPYTLTIKKSGYKTSKQTIVISGKIDWTIKIDRQRFIEEVSR